MRVTVLQYCSILHASLPGESRVPRLDHHQSVSQSEHHRRSVQPNIRPLYHSTLHSIVNIATALHCTALRRVHTAPRSCTLELHYPPVPWGLRTTTLSARDPAHASVQGITVTTVSDCRDCTTASAYDSQPSKLDLVGQGTICGLGASLTWNMGWDSLTTRPDMCIDGGTGA